MRGTHMSKDQILAEKGYKYDFNREVYYSKKAKKIFSVEAIKDHDVAWLKTSLACPSDDWKFYFNRDPSSNIKEKLIGYFR